MNIGGSDTVEAQNELLQNRVVTQEMHYDTQMHLVFTEKEKYKAEAAAFKKKFKKMQARYSEWKRRAVAAEAQVRRLKRDCLKCQEDEAGQ